MAPRHESDASSSPDPLAASFGDDGARSHRPLAASSPTKHTRRPATADVRLSPTKQMLLSTPRTGGHSPWRIKVTVQAEPGSDSESAASPIVAHVTHVNHVTRTKTTTIPLKDPHASSPAKRRGRPRKSDAPPKRSATPVRKRTASTPRRASAGDTSAADVDTDATPKKKRGRPRKIQPPAEDDIWGQARRSSVGAAASASASAAHVETDATPGKRRGRPRKSIQPPAQQDPVLPTEQPTLQSSPMPHGVGSELHVDTAPDPNGQDDGDSTPNHPTPQARTAPLKSTPIQTYLSRKLKARKNTPVAEDGELIDISSDEDLDEESDIVGELPISGRHGQQQAEEAVDGPGDFGPVQISAFGTSETEHEQQEETEFAFDEGATRMPDDTTVIDSENFSMISVDSLPSCASVTRPANGTAADSSCSQSHRPPQNQIYLDVPAGNLHGLGFSEAGARSSRSLPEDLPAAPPRYKTPSVEPAELSHPPPVEAVRLSPTSAQTPRIGRVVKAGAALQGVLDPNHVTPEAGQSKTVDERPVDERRDHLDDLFRGFSERTRRELHAGLRLGEQLAEQNGSNRPSSPASSGTMKTAPSNLPATSYIAQDAVPQPARLLTPDDQEDNTAPLVQPTELQYPVLPHSGPASGLLSPVSDPEDDDNEMSWRIDTPPMQCSNRAGTQVPTAHQSSETVSRDVPDMWEEEASRLSIVCGNNNARSDSALHTQDLLARDGAVKSAHGRLPGTWQKRTLDESHYKDEAEDSEVLTPPSTESDESPTRAVQEGLGKAVQPSASVQSDNDRDEDTEEADDTGMFFQANLPGLFKRKRPSDFRRRRAPQQDISLNLDESLLPESSPPPAAKTPAADRPNPFMDAPPQFAVLRSSPIKNSPLREELRYSDISSDAQQTFEESTLPLAPSSPFHTYVEGDTAISMASDQRQLIREMTQPDSSLRRIRDEADEYLDAYEPQERTLHDLTELTEPSRTWNKDSTVLASSPPKQVLESAPTKADKAKTLVPSRVENKECTRQQTDMSYIRTSTIRSPAVGTRSPPTVHPAISKLDSLPGVEPWTKTHYKALDKLYQLYKKQPSIFSTTEAPNAALNNTLLTNTLNETTGNFVGARYRAWGYNVIFTDALVVLCAAFMQLLTLNSVSEYEERAGKRIQVGDCQPGAIGTSIYMEAVVERLATVVLGEAVRKDEKRGKVIDKSGRLRVEWP